MTNQLIFLITIVSTNWVNVAGDWKRESGTNYVKQMQMINTNHYVVEGHMCWTTNLVNRGDNYLLESTNAPTRWQAVGVNAVPPLPGVKEKQ